MTLEDKIKLRRGITHYIRSMMEAPSIDIPDCPYTRPVLNLYFNRKDEEVPDDDKHKLLHVALSKDDSGSVDFRMYVDHEMVEHGDVYYESKLATYLLVVIDHFLATGNVNIDPSTVSEERLDKIDAQLYAVQALEYMKTTGRLLADIDPDEEIYAYNGPVYSNGDTITAKMYEQSMFPERRDD